MEESLDAFLQELLLSRDFSGGIFGITIGEILEELQVEFLDELLNALLESYLSWSERNWLRLKVANQV